MVILGIRVAVLVVLVFISIAHSVEQDESEGLISVFEKSALLQLRGSLGIRSKEWPIKENPCVSWIGITCRNGSVVGINVSGFRRTRVASRNPRFAVDALVKFERLSSFNASRFSLPGSIPELFGQLKTLDTLDLRFCLIRDAIPSAIGNMTALTYLYLSGNALTSMIPSSIGLLTNLAVLDLSGNMLTGFIPDSFSSLQNLTILDTSRNALSGPIPSAINALAKLQSMNLSGNNFGSTIPDFNFRDLTDIDLSDNSLSGSIPLSFRNMTTLRKLILSKNSLSGNLTEDSFPPQVQGIDLGQNMLSGEVPLALWSLPLISVDLSVNNFTGVLPAIDGNLTPSTLNISGNMFYGRLTTVLRRFASFDVSGNFFEGEVPSFSNESNPVSGNCLRNVAKQRSLEECSLFYLQKGLTFDNFGTVNVTEPTRRNRNKRLVVYVAAFGGLGLFIAAIVILLLVRYCCCKTNAAEERTTTISAAVPQIPTELTASPDVYLESSFGDKFALLQLLEATRNFSDSNLIKNGHSGALFKGVLENGVIIVVKKIDLSVVKKELHLVELDLFSKVSNPRLVPFLGHCLENENEKYLVYKYMPYDDLSSALYRKETKNDDCLKSLDWITRLKIATGAAEGLCYLHESSPSIVHSDVQASSILLDDKFEVRLGSLSSVSYQEPDPQQSRISRFLRLPQSSEHGSTCASDVYCFGKVLLELVTGKLGLSAAGEAELHKRLEELMPFISMYDKELVTKIVDPSLVVDDDLLEEVWAMAIIARSCLNPKPSGRPPMRRILKALENPLKVVREEGGGSGRLRASSRGSWHRAVTGSWRHGSGEATASGAKVEGMGSFKRSASNSQGSGNNGNGDNGSSKRRYSQEIFPDPAGDVERSA